jgi:EAL domain-containing protein (putative c-di-GMP-specific phosphodiesterase class I)
MRPSEILEVETLTDLLSRGFYSMAFQPIYETASRRVFGFEALLRGPQGTPLANPARLFHDRGYVPKDVLHDLDLACIGAALRTGRLLQPTSRIFVNVHGETLWRLTRQQKDLFMLLEQLEILPERIVLEISESTDKAHVRLIARSLRAFRDRGMRVALDDVGVSYPWMHHLLFLEPDFLKVDRSFIQTIHGQPRKQELMIALSFMAARMGAKLIAEGVETHDEWQTVADLQVPMAQGFWLGRPLPAESWAGESQMDNRPRAPVGAVFPPMLARAEEVE